MRLSLSGLAVLCGLAATPALAQPQPFELVRTLHSLQNEAAAGNAAAHAAQRELVRTMAPPMLAADAGIWSDPRNIRAAIAYVLSGGQPVVLKMLLDKGLVSPALEPLAKGAMAYVVGEEQEARDHLMQVDARSLPASLGAHVALVQANLQARPEPAKALQLLDLARLLAPGSLVEEAALRREVFIAGETGDLARLERTTSQYVRRFETSVYAENFRQRFAEQLLTFPVAQETAKFESLVATLAVFDRARRLALYLDLARDGLRAGRYEQAKLAAEQALGLAGRDAAANARARLYSGAAHVALSGGLEEGRLLLAKVSEAALPAADQNLLVTARAVVAKITADPQRVAAIVTAEPAVQAQEPMAPPATLQLIASAEQSLTEATSLLSIEIPRPPKPVDTSKRRGRR